jgi:phosphonatase-like hydrolase
MIVDDGRVAEAFETALGNQGLTVTPEQLVRVRGLRKLDAIHSMFAGTPEASRRADEAYDAFRSHLVAACHRSAPSPIQGAEEAVRILRTRNIRVALTTGFDRHVTDVLLEALQWRDRLFDAIVCGDEVRRGRPAPDLIEAAMSVTGILTRQSVAAVGDTAADLLAGSAAGVGWNIGVLSGAHDRPRLEAVPHTHLVQSVADVPALLTHR